MIVVLQRVSRASVRVDGEVVGAIEHGFLALVGIEKGDTEAECARMAAKIASVRAFAAEPGNEGPHRHFERSIIDVGGAVLLVSQFTLAGKTRKGTRPSFDDSERPEKALELFNALAHEVGKLGVAVQTGCFGAMMDVELINSGPVTLLLGSTESEAPWTRK